MCTHAHADTRARACAIAPHTHTHTHTHTHAHTHTHTCARSLSCAARGKLSFWLKGLGPPLRKGAQGCDSQPRNPDRPHVMPIFTKGVATKDRGMSPTGPCKQGFCKQGFGNMLLWLGWLACCAQPWLGLAWACLACLASNNNNNNNDCIMGRTVPSSDLLQPVLRYHPSF